MFTLTTKPRHNHSVTFYHSAEKLLQTVAAIDTPQARYCAQAIRNVIQGEISSYSDAMDVLSTVRLTIESHGAPQWPVALRF